MSLEVVTSSHCFPHRGLREAGVVELVAAVKAPINHEPDEPLTVGVELPLPGPKHDLSCLPVTRNLAHRGELIRDSDEAAPAKGRVPIELEDDFDGR